MANRTRSLGSYVSQKTNYIYMGLNTSSSWFCANIFWLCYDFNTLYCVLFCSIGPNVLWDFGPMYGIDTLQTIDLGY
jgi:hypothetical protein